MAVGESNVFEVQLDALLSQEYSIAARERRSSLSTASSPPAATSGATSAAAKLSNTASVFASSHPDKMAPVGKEKVFSVAALTDLGFEESAALAALAANSGDVHAAAALLLDGALMNSGGVSEVDGAFDSGAPATVPSAFVAPADALRVPIWADWLDGPFPAFELYIGEGGLPTFADVAAKGSATVPGISMGDMLVAIDGSPADKDVMRVARQLQRSRGAHVNSGLEIRLTIRSPWGAEWSLATGSGDQSGKLVSGHTIRKTSVSDRCGVTLQNYGESVVISEVLPGGLAAQAGLAVGMAIISIGGTVIAPPNHKRKSVTGYLHAAALLTSLKGAIEVKGDLSVTSVIRGDLSIITQSQKAAAGRTSAHVAAASSSQPNSARWQPQPQPSSSAPQENLMQQVQRIKEALELDPKLLPPSAIKAANEVMGITPEGPLPAQAATLLASLGV